MKDKVDVQNLYSQDAQPQATELDTLVVKCLEARDVAERLGLGVTRQLLDMAVLDACSQAEVR